MSTENTMKVKMANLINSWSEYVLTLCSRRRVRLPWEGREVVLYRVVFLFTTHVPLVVMALRM